MHAPGSADLNLYAYVHGRLLNAVDPVGLATIAVNAGTGGLSYGDHAPGSGVIPTHEMQFDTMKETSPGAKIADEFGASVRGAVDGIKGAATLAQENPRAAQIAVLTLPAWAGTAAAIGVVSIGYKAAEAAERNGVDGLVGNLAAETLMLAGPEAAAQSGRLAIGAARALAPVARAVAVSSASWGMGVGGGGAWVPRIVKPKRFRFPNVADITVNMDHILKNHTKGGDGYQSSLRSFQRGEAKNVKDAFPEHMGANEIERAVRKAYKYAQILQEKDGRSALLRGPWGRDGHLYMYFNRNNRVIETAIPKTPADPPFAPKLVVRPIATSGLRGSTCRARRDGDGDGVARVELAPANRELGATCPVGEPQLSEPNASPVAGRDHCADRTPALHDGGVLC